MAGTVSIDEQSVARRREGGGGRPDASVTTSASQSTASGSWGSQPTLERYLEQPSSGWVYPTEDGPSSGTEVPRGRKRDRTYDGDSSSSVLLDSESDDLSGTEEEADACGAGSSLDSPGPSHSSSRRRLLPKRYSSRMDLAGVDGEFEEYGERPKEQGARTDLLALRDGVLQGKSTLELLSGDETAAAAARFTAYMDRLKAEHATKQEFERVKEEMRGVILRDWQNDLVLSLDEYVGGALTWGHPLGQRWIGPLLPLV